MFLVVIQIVLDSPYPATKSPDKMESQGASKDNFSALCLVKRLPEKLVRARSSIAVLSPRLSLDDEEILEKHSRQKTTLQRRR